MYWQRVISLITNGYNSFFFLYYEVSENFVTIVNVYSCFIILKSLKIFHTDSFLINNNLKLMNLNLYYFALKPKYYSNFFNKFCFYYRLYFIIYYRKVTGVVMKKKKSMKKFYWTQKKIEKMQTFSKMILLEFHLE